VIVIGVVLLVLAAIGIAAAISMGRDMNVHIDGWGIHVDTTVLWVFVAGAVAMLLLLMALGAFRRAARRRMRQRRELKQLRAEEALAAEERTRNEERARTEDRSGDAVDVRDPEGVHAYRGEADDPGPERRYVPGDERVT
jgi:uncharacterized membrane protein